MGTATADVSGNLNLGEYHNGPSLTYGEVAGALEFNGINSFVQVNHSPSVALSSGRFTLDFWIRPAPGELSGTIFRKGLPGPDPLSLQGQGFHLYYAQSGHFLAFLGGNVMDLSPNLTDHAPPEIWTFVAVAVDLPGQVAKLYVNGLLAKTTPLTGLSAENTEPIIIGGYELGPSQQRSFAGGLDEMELFDRVLSDQEIRSIFLAQSAGKCKPNRLQGGKVVFSSDRVKPPQLFIQQVGGPPPMQVTSEPFGARHAKWSRNGKYIVYITSDVIVGESNSNSIDKLVVITESGQQLMYLLAGKFGARSLGYPQWSDDGRSIVTLFGWSTGARGLGIIHFATPYQFTYSPVLSTLLYPGQIPGLNPGEPIFSRDGKSVYFAADTSVPGQLYRMPAAGGTPTPVLGNGAQVRRAYAPSLSPDGTRLLYNSEMWKEDPAHYQDEELLELGLLTGVIRRVTAEPGNQYGFFAKNGAGEMLVQSNRPATGKYDLYLEENGVRVPLDDGDSTNASTESGDWWKRPCGGSAILWAGGEAVGCKFPAWGPEQKSLCASWAPLLPSGNGSCALCVDSQWVDPILKGVWSDLTEGADVTTAVPADLSCQACVSPPDRLTGWWPLDELSGTTVADLSASAANGTRTSGTTPVPGRVKTGLKLSGNGAYVQVPNLPALNVSTGNFSLEAWVKIDSPADLDGIRVIVEKRQSAPWLGYSFFLYNGRLGLQLADGQGSQYSNFLASVQVPANGGWHLVAVTVNRALSTGIQFYLDGDPAGAPFNPTGRKGTLFNNRPLRIGSLTPAAPGSFFKGSLDEVALYQKVLTPQEVRLAFLAGPFGMCKK